MASCRSSSGCWLQLGWCIGQDWPPRGIQKMGCNVYWFWTSQKLLGDFKQLNGKGENFHANYINILQNWNAWPSWIFGTPEPLSSSLVIGPEGWMCTMMAASSTSSDRRVCWFCRRGLTALSTAWIWIMAWPKLVPAKEDFDGVQLSHFCWNEVNLLKFLRKNNYN